MATIGSLVVNLIANTAGFSSGLSKAKKEVGGFQSDLSATKSAVSGFGSIIATAGAALGVGFSLKTMIDEASEAQSVMAQLEAVITSTGYAAGLTAGEIDVMAGDLQKVTRYSDETTKSAAAVLATFTNIKGDVFKEALTASQDLNTALGGDLQGNIIQIGKALNDPVAGVKALTKVGVSFSAQQKEQIKTLVESGQVTKAQQIILAELAKEFGGSATAAGKTFAGQMTILKNLVAELMEGLGTMFLPYLQRAAEFGIALTQNAAALKNIATVVAGVAIAFIAYKAVLIAAALVNVIFTGSIPFVGIGLLLAGAAATAAAVIVFRNSLKDAGETAAGSADGIDKAAMAAAQAKTKLREARAAAAAFKDSIGDLGDKKLLDARRDRDAVGMSPAAKAARDYQIEAIELLAKNKAEWDKLSAAQKAAIMAKIKLRATEIMQEVRSAEIAREQQKANEDIAAAQKELDDFAMNKRDEKSAGQKRADELRDMGLGVQAKEMDRIASALKLKQIQKEMRDMGIEAAKETLNAEEKRRVALMDINALQRNGAIDLMAAERERAKIFSEFRQAKLRENSPIGFLEQGSAEAISAVRASKNDPLSNLDQTAKEQLATQLDIAAAIRSNSDLLKLTKVYELGGPL